jgi:DNA polymerase III subunit beta
MKLICNRSALLEALNVAGNAIATRTPKPALQCVKLTAGPDRLIVAATDLEVAIRYSDAQVQVEQQGEALVPLDNLRDIVRESIDDTLSLELTSEGMNIKGQDSHFRIFVQDPSDFPPVPDFEGEADFEVEASHLKQLIAQTLFAVAKESTRYAFNGVLLNIKSKKLVLVGTDGRRLAHAKGDLASLAKAESEGVKAIVPQKTLTMIEKLLTDGEEKVAIQVRENQIIFHTQTATLTSNLVEGQYPPYEDVIPKDSDKKMTAGTADLLSAVRRASLLVTEDTKGVRFAFSKKGLVLTSRSPEAGESTINFACKFDGEEVEIGFNPTFLIEALKVADSDEISLEMTMPNRPGLFKSGANFQYVIMPVNLQ